MGFDQFLPHPDFRERHAITIPAPPQTVWKVIQEFDLTESRVARTLFATRNLISRARHGGDQKDVPMGPRAGVSLAEQPPSLLIRGLVGRWWTIGGASNLTMNGAEEFLAFDRAGYAKAIFGLELIEVAGGGTRLVTETRVLATDAGARRQMARYWVVIRPFSGLLRRILLRRLRAKATAR